MPTIERERNPEKEYIVKAAMLVKFHQLITWPEMKTTARNRTETREVRIAVIGRNPFPPQAREIFGIASNEQVRYVFRKSDKSPKSFCHIAFIADDRAHDVEEILQRLHSTPTLTVSDIPGFAHRGGCIELFLYGNRVLRFLINEQARLDKGLIYSPGLRNPQIARLIRKRH